MGLMYSKGISPIISVIILVALAITVGIMVTTWVTHWVTTQTGKSSISCAIDTNYIIEQARWNISSSLNNTLLLKIVNKGSQKLYGFGVILDNGTKILQFNSSSRLIDQGNISSSNQLQREQAVYIAINLSNSTLGYPPFGATVSSVKVTNDACDSVSAATTSITTV